MMKLKNAPADARKAVAPRHTFEFGFRDECRGASLDVRNGRLFEKTQRKIIFFEGRMIVKH